MSYYLHSLSLVPLFSVFPSFPAPFWFSLPPTPCRLVPVVKYSYRLVPLSSPETFHNALVFPAG